MRLEDYSIFHHRELDRDFHIMRVIIPYGKGCIVKRNYWRKINGIAVLIEKFQVHNQWRTVITKWRAIKCEPESNGACLVLSTQYTMRDAYKEAVKVLNNV